jgi:hypothetical protein
MSEPPDFGCLDRSRKTDFATATMGYRSTHLPVSGCLLVSLYAEQGRKDSACVDTLETGSKLEKHRSELLLDAMCHALNSGMTTTRLMDIAQEVVAFAERAPFEVAVNVEPLGLLVDRHPAVRYVYAIEDNNDEVLVIRPDANSEVVSNAELIKSARRV